MKEIIIIKQKKNEKPNLFALKQQSNNIFVGNKFTNIKFFFLFFAFVFVFFFFHFCFIYASSGFYGFYAFPTSKYLVRRFPTQLSPLFALYAPVAAVSLPLSLSLSLHLHSGRRPIFDHLSLSLSLQLAPYNTA